MQNSPSLGATGGSTGMRKSNYSNNSNGSAQKIYGSSSNLNKKSAALIPKAG
jgi:hypothetical protein